MLNLGVLHDLCRLVHDQSNMRVVSHTHIGRQKIEEKKKEEENFEFFLLFIFLNFIKILYE